MKSLLIALLCLLPFATRAAADCTDEALAATAAAAPGQGQAAFNKASKACGERTGQCYTRITTACPIAKKPAPPKPAPAPAPVVEYRDRVVVKFIDVLVPGPTLIVTRTKYVRVPRVPVLKCPGCGPEGDVVFGGWAALGLGVRDPYTSGNIGLLLQVPKAYVGLRVYSALQYGVGVQFLPYVYRGNRVQVHVLDPGYLITGGPFKYLSDPDVPRHIDLLVGAGVQVKLTCHLALTADLRTAIPDPTKLKDCVGSSGQRVDAAAAVGNAFAATQLLVGLLLHN